MGSLEDDVPRGRYILFKPVAENFTDPLMPLTEDILLDLMPMMKVIHGRVYVHFDHVRALIPLKMSDDDIARLAYLSAPLDNKLRISIPRLLLVASIVFFNYLVMGVFNRRVAAMPDDFMQSYRQYFEKVVDDHQITAPNTLVQLFLNFRFFEPAGNMVLLVNLVAPRYILFMRMISSLLERWTPQLPSDSASLLCSGASGVLSVEMGRDILGLARVAKKNQIVSDIIQKKSAKEARQDLSMNDYGSEFSAALTDFLTMHGHRALKEFELNSVRWEEDPSPVLGMVRNYLLVETDLEDTEANVRQHRQTLRAQLSEQISRLPFESFGHPRRRIINFLINQTRYYMKLRENSRFYHIMGFYAVRKKILKIEAQLLDQNRLKCKDDIFYLHWQEIQALERGELTWPDVEDTIRTRRMEHIRRTKMTPPKTIGIDIDDILPEQSGKALVGQGASPGTYEGIARVIMDPATDSEIKPGEILVAPYTDPAWTPLFLTANAAVIEVGSYLSHAGTIAREYGMPCVVDVTNCTSKITTGTRILVDGTRGSVSIIDEESD